MTGTRNIEGKSVLRAIVIGLCLAATSALYTPAAPAEAPLARVRLADIKVTPEDKFWASPKDAVLRDLLDNLEGDLLDAPPADDTLDVKPVKAEGQSAHELEPRIKRVPPTSLFVEPTKAEKAKKDPRHLKAVAGQYAPIRIPKFWKGTASTPRRRLFLEIRYKDVVPKMARVYVYNGRTFRARRDRRTKRLPVTAGYRLLGHIAGVDDARWKTAVFETSPFDFRYEEKWKGTRVLVYSVPEIAPSRNPDDRWRAAAQQKAADLPIEYVTVREPTPELEVAAATRFRDQVFVRTDVLRREHQEKRWEDQRDARSQRLVHVPARPDPYPEKYDKQGFIPFRVGMYELVTPYSAPRKRQVTESIDTFLTPAEYEAVNFALYPLKNIRDLRYDVGRLEKDDGTVFRGWVDPGRVEYTPVCSSPRKSVGMERKLASVWHTQPVRIWSMREHDSLECRKAVPRWFWMTIHAFPDCDPGTYRTTIRVMSASTKPFTMPLQVEVLPFRAPTTTELGKECGHTMSPTSGEFDYWNLAQHNFNTVHTFWNCGINAYLAPNVIDINYGGVDRKMKFAKKVGFLTFIIEMANLRAILSKGFPDCIRCEEFADFGELYARGCFMMREHAKANNWPDLGYCPSDEPWGFGMWHLNEVVRRWMTKYDPETPVYGNFYGGHHCHVFKNFKIINTNACGGDPFMPYEAFQYGIRLWEYGGRREKFLPWAYDVAGIIKYRYDRGPLVHRDLSDAKPDLYGHRGEAVPVIEFERRREGLDGCRYAWYLQRLLKEKPHPAIEKEFVNLQYAYKANYYNRRPRGYRGPLDPGTTLDFGRKNLIGRAERFLASWKGKDEEDPSKLSVAGRWVKREMDIHKANLGKPKPDLSYDAVRRRLADWILEVLGKDAG